jgi:hypothetical protein
MPRMKSNGWFNLIFLIVLAAGIYFIVTTVRDAVNQTAQQASSAFQPLQEANSAMQTQVSQLMNPTPTIIPDPVTYITEIRALARLETIQYSVTQVVEYQDRQGTFAFLFGTKILVKIHGKVIAGIDMGKISPEHMRYEGGVLYVTLPPAEVFSYELDESKTQAWDLQNGLFVDVDPNAVLEALQTGREVILKAAMEDGILTQAQINAEAFLLKFFAALGFPNTIFVR